MLNVFRTRNIAVLGLLAGCILASAAPAQTSKPVNKSEAAPPSTSTPAKSPYRRPHFLQTSLPPHARNFYQLTWGVDTLTVRAVDSGQLIRFDYRVVDAEKAKPLNEKKATPFLIDETARVKLVVPTMEKVGQLRQSATPQLGRTYWMVFSNKGGLVKRGDRVSIAIGKFHVNGLVVE